MAEEISENVIKATSENWDEAVMKSKLPVLVDFWAEWCGPCRMVGPVIEELAKEYKGKMLFAKLNVDENQPIAMRYGVMSIPTLGFFNKGEPVDGVVGALPKSALQQKVDGVLGKVVSK